MKYCLIGCGRISRNHITAALRNDLDIVAVSDLDYSKANLLLEKNGIQDKTKIYTDYKEMIVKEKPDLVAIATDSGSHAEIAIECIKYKIHLIIEKPIALSIEDADNIIEMARINNVIVSTCHQNRFNKAIQKTREAIELNSLGKLLYGTAHIRWSRDKHYYLESKWRGTWAKDGGALMNQCIHNIDLLIWLMNSDVSEVFAYTDNLNHNYIETEDFGIAVLKFNNGKYGLIEGTTSVFKQNLEETLYLFGQKGTIKIGGKSVNIIDEWQVENCTNASDIKQEHSELPSNIYGFGHIHIYKDMISSIKNSRAPYVTGLDGKKAMEVVIAIYKSAVENKPIKLPLKEGKTLDFVGRFK